MCGRVLDRESFRRSTAVRTRAGAILGATIVMTLGGAVSAAARIPNDTKFSQMYGLHNTGQVVGTSAGRADADIDAPEAWDVTTGSSEVKVAVVDDGVNYNLADLTPNLVAGYDFGNGDANPAQAESDHGSQTASLLGARGNNASGLAGVSWLVSMMPLKVRTDGPGERFNLIEPTAVADAFRYAGSSGARVANASFGLRSTTTAAERTAVLEALRASPDTLFVVSAGNSATDNDATPRYPCNFNLPNLLCVAATDKNDALWASSSYGRTSVQLAAPGAQVYTVNGTSYGFFDGTSYAAPLVSGAAALYFARYPAATVADVRNALLTSVDALPTLAGKTVTGGRLNAARALSVPPGAPPPPPSGSVVASDVFDRSVSGGWGSAQTGGAWSVVVGSATPFSVDGAQGLVSAPSGAGERQVALTSTSVRDVDARVDVSFANATGSSGSFYAYETVRRQSDGSHIRVGLLARGSTLLIRGQTSEGTQLWTNVNTGLGFVAGTRYSLRVQAEGSAPTTLRARAWKQGTSEPSTWAVTATTNTGPQVAGAVGLRTANDSATSTTIALDNYTATPLGAG